MIKSIFIGLIIILGALVGGFFILNSYIYNEKQAVTADDYKEAEYIIEGERVRLGDEAHYFGNELPVDLDRDGRQDMVFFITHEPGGSGTFYYAVAALNTESGYVGSEGYFLGDRIAPQTIDVSQNPRHRNVIVVNYVDRQEGEPMTTAPSVGKSVYLKLDVDSLRWGIVEPDFEGEGTSLPPAGGEVTLRGQMTCLPKRGSGAQTMECAIGLRAEDGSYYALRNLSAHDPTYQFSQTDMRVEVSGTITYEEQLGPDGNPYDIVGVISVTSITES